MQNDDGIKVKPGTSICASCITPAMLDAEAAYVTRHFRIAVLACNLLMPATYATLILAAHGVHTAGGRSQ